MKPRKIASDLKKLFKRTKKRYRALYVKRPVLTLVITIMVAIIVLGGSSYGVYRLATQANQATAPVALNEVEGSTETTDNQNDTDASGNHEESDGSVAGAPEAATCNYSGSLLPMENSQTVKDSITIGGPKITPSYPINIRSSNGKKMTPLKVSTSPSFKTASQKLELSGLDVWEKNADLPSSDSRFIHFKQVDASSSGNVVVYVFAGCEFKPAAINVSWSPYAEMRVEQTSHNRVVSGNVESYTFNFKIVPNAHFGTPTLSLRLAGDYANYCDSGSVKSISTTYNGTKSFTLTCKYTTPLPPCTPPSPNNCRPYFQVYIDAGLSSGDRVSVQGRYFVYYF